MFIHQQSSIPSSSAYPSMSITGIQGHLLEVTVVGCNKLKDTEWFSRQDPYVCLEYASTKYRTRTCTDGGKHPTFQEKFVFTLIEGLRELNVVVWNSNTISYDDFIGSGKVQLQKVLSQGYDDSPWPLQTKTGRHAGEVRLILHYENANKSAASHARSAPPHASHAPSAAPHAIHAPSATPPAFHAVSAAPHSIHALSAAQHVASSVPKDEYYAPPPVSAAPYPQPATAYPAPSPYPSYPPNPAAYPASLYPPPQTAAYPPQPYPPPSAYPPQQYPPPPQASPYCPPGPPYAGLYPPPPY